MNEQLDQLEDSIRDLDLAIKEVDEKHTQISKSIVDSLQPIEKNNSILSFNSNNINDQCTWRISSPTKTTFEVRDFI